jgi:hypothetical protein
MRLLIVNDTHGEAEFVRAIEPSDDPLVALAELPPGTWTRAEVREGSVTVLRLERGSTGGWICSPSGQWPRP